MVGVNIILIVFTFFSFLTSSLIVCVFLFYFILLDPF